jgi:hypothetical protein
MLWGNLFKNNTCSINIRPMNHIRIIFFFLFFCLSPFLSTAQKDWSAYDFSRHYDAKVWGGKKPILENKRVFVSDFVISQVVMANGKQMGAASFAKMSINMSPLDQKAYTELVNRLYKEFIQGLQAQGFEIVSDEEVAASEFVKEANEKKNVYAWTTDNTPLQDTDQFGSETMRFRPEKKYIVVNSAKILGNFNPKYSKAINAQIIYVNLAVNFVTFDGARRAGYKGRTTIEATPYLMVTPTISWLNDRGGINAESKYVEANTNWVGEKGIDEISTNSTVFGAVKGTYIMDINESVYMSEISSITQGLIKGYTATIKKELE